MRYPVLKEGNYEVFFSDEGREKKEHPVLLRRTRNRSGIKKPCVVPGCSNWTRASTQVCSKHDKEIKKGHETKWHTKDWIGYFESPSSKASGNDQPVPWHGWLAKRILDWAGQDSVRLKIADSFMEALENEIPGKIPDSSTLANGELLSNQNFPTPEMLVDFTTTMVEKHFPSASFSGNVVPHCTFPKRKPNPGFEVKDMPIRVVAALTILGMICEEANRGDTWYRLNVSNPNGGGSGRAGAYYAISVYLLMRRGKMNTAQLAKMLQVSPWS